VVQVASDAEVVVDGVVVARLDSPGLVVLVGVTHTDTPASADALAEKVWQLRVLPGEVSAATAGAPVLVVSQFTLYADLSRGRRPSWSPAAPREVAGPLVDAVVDGLRRRGAAVATGVFGATMTLRLANEGPVTLVVEV